MAELKAKVTLKAKGEEAYVSIAQLMVTLKWSAAVDLDLMAFYKAKDGRVGGVYSDNYAGGSLGNLNAFPYIQLSGDAGTGAKGGDNEEVLRITKLDDIAELYICTVNFTDASKNSNSSFSKYDAGVVVMDDKGESVAVPLDSTQPGTVAIIAKIDNSGFMGAKLVNENRVVDMGTFQSSIPGAGDLKVSSKVMLKSKNQSVELKTKSGGGLGELMVNLNWNQGGKKSGGGFLGRMLGGGGGDGIDLDLGCLFELRNGKKGTIQALGNALGSYNGEPYIQHMGDDRTGSWSEGENIKINGVRVSEIKRILFFTFIYEGVANWSQADAVVTIKQPSGPEIVIELDEHRNGKIMCALALFENVGENFSVKRLVEYFDGHEPMDRRYNWGLRWVAGRK
jgi:uncharacterized protein involved in tellurium resistance